MPCGEQEFRGNNRLRAVEKTDFAQRLLLRKLYLQLNQILQVAPSLSGRIYFTDTKYVANISALRVHQLHTFRATGNGTGIASSASNSFPSDSLVAGQLRPPRSLNPLGGINNGILAACFLGSGDLPEPLEMTLAECVEFLHRAKAGRRLVTADASCELLGYAKSVNQFESYRGFRSPLFSQGHG